MVSYDLWARNQKLLSIGFEILGLVPPRLFHLLCFADKKLGTALLRNLQL